MFSRFPKQILGLVLALGVLAAPSAALANNPAATAAGLAIDAVIVGLQAAIAADSAISGGESGKASARTSEEVGNRVVDPVFAMVMRSVGLNLLNFVTNRLAYDAAVALASGGRGQTGLIEFRDPQSYFKDLGLDIVGETLGSLDSALSSALDQDFGLCAPKDPLVRLSLQIGIKQQYQRNKPSCDFEDFLTNINAIGSRFLGQPGGDQGILRQFAKAYRPGQNELSASIELNLAVQQQVNLAKEIGLEETLANEGFKNVVDSITGQVKTPAALIKKQTEASLILAKNDQQELLASVIGQADANVLKQIGLSGLSVFANTLLSNLANNLFSGLFNPPETRLDPFNPTASVINGRARAEETFRSILAAPILSFDDYSIMNEFVICPGDDLRGLNNCVMDTSFASAVSRGKTQQALTVQDAIDQGFLHGSWPLIPAKDEGRNQDLRCYTYGYCYANLVKMRKARILPVGWELAANSPWNDEASPVTLQEAIDGFFNCNDEGQADANHKWCHLIDPNWVLKVPPAQCRAFVPGELPISGLVNARQSVCVDSPTCIAQDGTGACVGGYGYCTEEKNVWQFPGDSCPVEYAGCLSFDNVRTGETGTYLINTVNSDGCSSDNPGCRWYRTNKYLDDQGTPDTADDTFAFLPSGESYTVATHDEAVRTSTSSNPLSGAYDAGYAYLDRLYLNQNVGTCNESAAGCSELVPATTARLNLVRNPGFEEDEDGDGIPDGWTGDFAGVSGTSGIEWQQNGGRAFEGVANVFALGTPGDISQTGIALSPNRFYTLSFYVSTPAGSGATGDVLVNLVPQSGVGTVNLTGTTVVGNCTVLGNTLSVDASTVAVAGEGFKRAVCTFTTPAIPTFATVTIHDQPPGAVEGTSYDAFQLELGSLPSRYQDGYGSASVARAYLRVAPSWLGCTGAATDPAECGDYTQMCTAQDVGCELYTPSAGGIGVPAVTSSADVCPTECVGYETYKQEATAYEAEAFPLYFIASSARTCSQADVGCDAYTNVDAADRGGEDVEYYSSLRFCALPSQTSSAATYYTWEGTASAGFQLRSWSLLESNLSDSQTTAYKQGSATVFTESNVGRAPCVNPVVVSEDQVVCADASREPRSTTETDTFTECNEHADIFTNPDCREFYDVDGGIHYRLLSKTAVISESCAPYRKDTGTEADCTNAGGLWSGGACRYFVLSDESRSCSVAAAGCRAYTGASGRNASTVFEDTFEDGALTEYTSSSTAALSNDSVAAGGASLRVLNGVLPFRTLSLVEGTAQISSGDTNGNSQCDAGETCTLRDSGGATCTVVGTEANNADDCGALVEQLAQGKVYVLEFWAKGEGPVQDFNVGSGLTERGTTRVQPRLVDGRGAGAVHAFNTLGDGVVTLTPEWRLYTVGPLDTSDSTVFANFSDTAVLEFIATGGTAPYAYTIDNVRLRETEANVALVKDSWVTPSTCDISPSGVPAPQYFLGCQEYQDRAGESNTLFQFTRICQEKVVGCQAYYATQNSEPTYGQTFNATCTLPSSVTTPTACQMNGETVCTVASGKATCHFDYDGVLALPLPAGISLGPEARVVSGDTDIFLVDQGNTSCGAAFAGCREVGLPTFSQDKTTVTGFTSTFVIDDPDTYATTLCDREGLFCEAWKTLSDGTFYFKSPESQTCEYRSNVVIAGQAYSGWFREGLQTPTPCYYEDGNTNGIFDAGEVASAYLISGVEFGIWRNGDTDHYDGWVASCPDRYNRCTEFFDPMQTASASVESGKVYAYLKNEKLDETRRPAAERCDGLVSLSDGCALFYDAVNPEYLWNASASYIQSEHADLLFGAEPQAPRTPISCDGAASTNDIGSIRTEAGVEFNVCRSRCAYDPAGVGSVEAAYLDTYTDQVTGNTKYYTTSCVMDRDCPALEDSNNQMVSGTCVQNYAASASGLQPAYDANVPPINWNDVNDVRRVSRDRECSEWLTCRSTIQVWDDRTGRYKEVCDQVGSCVEYAKVGDVNVCVAFSDSSPDVLSMRRYVDRDVSWWGPEYSGYAVPGNIPTELLSQVNVNPDYVCVDDPTVSCTLQTSLSRCGADDACVPASEDRRLAFVAGQCNSDNLVAGATCYVGSCTDNGEPCSDNGQCNAGAFCAVGQCEQTEIGVSCSETIQCGSGFTCQSGLCKRQTNIACSPASATPTCQSTSAISSQCVLRETSFKGSCYNSQCLLSVDGKPFTPGFTNAIECKAYPEQNSPYPHAIVGGDTSGGLTATGLVTKWVDPSVSGADPEEQSTLMSILSSLNPADDFAVRDWVEYTKRPGYQGVQSCAPNGGDCSCTYQKVTYGTSVKTKYYSRDASPADVLTGVCVGGDREGVECIENSACGDLGRCVLPTSVETMLGVDGYCLERDTAINKWKDPHNQFGGECLTWLPVDQLTGSDDIYNAYTSAGALLDQEALYCTDTDLYVDLYVTGSTNPGAENNTIIPACAESMRFDQGPRGGGYGGRCQASPLQQDGCGDNAHCPLGYFAIVGVCEESGLGQNNCVQGGASDGRDDDCPYFCVPYDAIDPYEDNEEDAMGRCAPPALTHISTSGSSPIFNDWSTKVYLADTGISATPPSGQAFGASNWIERYKNCVRRGVLASDTTAFDLVNPSYSNNGIWGYRHLGQATAAQYYLGCSELSATSDPAGVFGGNGMINKAWTDRLWVEKENNQYEVIGLDYDARTEPDTPAGRVLGGETILGEMSVWLKRWEADQTFPVPIQSCQNGGLLYLSDASGACPAGGAVREYSPYIGPAGMQPIARGFDPNVQAQISMVAGTSAAIDCEDTVTSLGDDSICNSGKTCNLDTPECRMTCDPGDTDSCLRDRNGDGDTNDSGENLGTCTDTGVEFVCSIAYASGSCSGSLGESFVTVGVCQGGGAFAGELCSENEGCWDRTCDLVGVNDYRCSDSSTTFSGPTVTNAGGSVENNQSNLLTQLFAKIWKRFTYQPATGEGSGSSPAIRGEYVGVSDTTVDYSNSGSDLFSDIPGVTSQDATPPVVYGLGDCFSNGCREATDNTITVNGVTGGTIVGVDGAVHVSVQFFAEANKNQLPIRNVFVNWGDGHTSGSDSSNNYYKNRRGLDITDGDAVICGRGDVWGETSESCDPSYFTFTHDYTCTATDVGTGTDALPDCGLGEDETDGCKEVDTCYFVPRVYVKDNWGYCTGECGGANSPGGTSCYDNTGASSQPFNECDPICDGPGSCPASIPLGSVNPWVSFNGVVQVNR